METSARWESYQEDEPAPARRREPAKGPPALRREPAGAPGLRRDAWLRRGRGEPAAGRAAALEPTALRSLDSATAAGAVLEVCAVAQHVAARPHPRRSDPTAVARSQAATSSEFGLRPAATALAWQTAAEQAEAKAEEEEKGQAASLVSRVRFLAPAEEEAEEVQGEGRPRRGAEEGREEEVGEDESGQREEGFEGEERQRLVRGTRPRSEVAEVVQVAEVLEVGVGIPAAAAKVGEEAERVACGEGRACEGAVSLSGQSPGGAGAGAGSGAGGCGGAGGRRC
mmetsp:Transcript_173202/g.555478  ORF Transcript_173202/g.555478 Transcript_173202/m.555478 type:complete len:283 (-) Transcript_173202:1321-2169(-)